MVDFPVYDPWPGFERIVDSAHGANVKYKINAGTVNWDRTAGGDRVALWVLMDYDGQVNYKMPPHILEQDLPAVIQAITELQASLKERHLIQPVTS